MANLGVVAAAWSLNKWPGSIKGLAIAIIAAVFSSLSLSGGLFSWIAVMPMLIFARPRNRWHVVLWISAAALVFGAYMHNYVKPPEHPSLTSFLDAPGNFVRYIGIYLGSPLGFGKPDVAVFLGILTLILAAVSIFLLRRHGSVHTVPLLPWFAIGLQAVMCALGTAIGRSGYGARQAMASRYSTFASLLLIAVFVVVTRWLAVPRDGDAKRRRVVRNVFAAALLSIFAVTYTLTFRYSLRAMESRRSQLRACQAELMALPHSSEEALGQLYPRERIQDLRARIQALREMGMLSFR